MVRVAGWLLLFLGVLALGVEVQHLVDGEGKNVVLGLVIGAFFAGTGGLLLRQAARRGRLGGVAKGGAAGLPLDARIFRMAQDSRGRITAVEVSAALGVDFETAREELNALQSRGACQLLVTDDGVSVYRFPEFELGNDKRDIMELPPADSP